MAGARSAWSRLPRVYRSSTSHAKAPDLVWLSDIIYLWARSGWM